MALLFCALWLAFGTAVAGQRLLLVNTPYPPFVNPAGDPQGEGIDIEIAREAMARAGYELEVRLVPWKRALSMLERGEADLTTTISKNGDRDRFLAWTNGYRNSVRYHFYTRSDAPFTVQRLEDLDGHVLGVTTGFFYPPKLTERSKQTVRTGGSLTATVQMLHVGRTEIIIVNGLAGAWEIQRLKLAQDLRLHPFTYSSDSPTYMAFSRARGLTKALDDMNAALAAMAKDGSIARIEKKYVSP
jgi:polar amino acid transport system substrate-binding protein